MNSLKFSKAHASISDFESVDIPDFSIITGINGSGKSHFLQAIKNGSILVEGITLNDKNIILHDWTSLAPTKSSVGDPIKLSKERKAYLQTLNKKIKDIYLNYQKQIDSINQKISNIDLTNFDSLLNITEADFISAQNGNPFADAIWKSFSRYTNNTNQGIDKVFNGTRSLRDRVFEYALRKNKQVKDLEIHELDECIPLEWKNVSVFQQNLTNVFCAYHRAFDQNRYNLYKNEKYGESRPFLAEDEFINRFGEPPWIFLNKILDEAGLDYEVNSPDGDSDELFNVILINKSSKSTVSFESLSSGEKIIMSFALCLYNLEDNNSPVDPPKLLLLDEVDAPLHPSMTKYLINVLANILVKERKIKVILTTHSPSTVAFSPVDSIYRFDKNPRRLIRCSREHAIQVLTDGYISVTESSRFVIVEAKQDRVAYTGMVRKLSERGKLNPMPNLVFIQASDKKDRHGGGREQVKNWGAKLPAAGLNQILGLIDRDAGNASSDNIKVIGRYSLENYLLDPIVIYAVLMHHGKHQIFPDFGYKDGNYFDLRKSDAVVLQDIANFICSLIQDHHSELSNITGTFAVEYVGGVKINAPRWLRDYRGHDLESAVRETFKKIVGNSFIITRNDCEDMIEMISDRLPEFIPVELVSTFSDLQNA